MTNAHHRKILTNGLGTQSPVIVSFQNKHPSGPPSPSGLSVLDKQLDRIRAMIKMQNPEHWHTPDAQEAMQRYIRMPGIP